MTTIQKPTECEPTYHYYYALEPFTDPVTGAVTVLALCTKCSNLVRWDLNLNTREPAKAID